MDLSEAIVQLETEEARDKARAETQLYNPYHGLECGRQLEEGPREFSKRLPPRSTSRAPGKLSWICVANPYAPRHDVGDLLEGPLEEGSHLSKFVELGDKLLDDLEEVLVRLKIGFNGPNTLFHEAAANERAKTIDEIHKLSVDLRIKSGKWMLFVAPEVVNLVWLVIVRATLVGFLGISAKVAPWDEDEDPKQYRRRLICIYTADWTNKRDVMRVLWNLWKLELVFSYEDIPYKPDAYSHLELFKGNIYGIQPRLYSSLTFFDITFRESSINQGMQCDPFGGHQQALYSLTHNPKPIGKNEETALAKCDPAAIEVSDGLDTRNSNPQNPNDSKDLINPSRLCLRDDFCAEKEQLWDSETGKGRPSTSPWGPPATASANRDPTPLPKPKTEDPLLGRPAANLPSQAQDSGGGHASDRESERRVFYAHDGENMFVCRQDGGRRLVRAENCRGDFVQDQGAPGENS